MFYISLHSRPQAAIWPSRVIPFFSRVWVILASLSLKTGDMKWRICRKLLNA